MKKALLVWSCLCILMGSCTNKKVIDDLDLVQASGCDLKGENLEFTFVVPIFAQKEKNSVVTYTSVGKTPKEAKSRAEEKSFEPLVSGQLRLSVYSNELAEKGLFNIIDNLDRDPSIGNLVYLAIIEGKVKEFLNIKPAIRKNIALYGKTILESNIEIGNLPHTNLHSFLFQYFQVGQDPYLPILKKDGKKIKIEGVALFQGDKYVSKIPAKKLFLFKSLVEVHKEGTYGIEFGGGESISIHNIYSRPKYEVTVKNGKPFFTIHVKMKGRIEALSKRKNLEEEQEIKRIETKTKKLWEKDAKEIVTSFQKHNVDPIGFGAVFKEHYRNFDEKKWKEMYSDAPIEIKYDVNIVQSGITE
jgi:spore germination protein